MESKMRNRLFLWSLLSAFLILLFTTRSSILYVCNNWDDANSYFSMGKGMMNGLVIYRDLYDQKGPYLYLLYAIAYLISNRSFFGVFIFEIIAAAIFLFYAGKTIARRSGSARAVFVMIPVLAAGVYSSWSFYFGGAAEEFCLPLLAISLYLLDELLHDEVEEKRLGRTFICAGLCAGVVAQVKYTMLGFFFAWFVVAFIWIWMKRGFGSALKRAGLFILFAMIPSVPWFVYFMATGSLDDWFRCYIYNNIFFYSQVSTESYSFFNKLYEMCKTLYWLIRDSFSYFIWIIAGFVLQIVREKGVIRRFVSAFMFAFTFFVIFIGGNKLAYYSIPLMVFAVYGVSYVGELGVMAFDRFGKTSGKEVESSSDGAGRKLLSLAVLAVVMVASVLFASGNTINADYRKYTRGDVWLMDAAQYLTSEDTLLELNTIDPGLYTVTGIVPSCEYFQTNGINLETMFEEQKKYLKEGRTDYVLAVGFEPEFIDINYELIKVYDYKEKDHNEMYYLYHKKVD